MANPGIFLYKKQGIRKKRGKNCNCTKKASVQSQYDQHYRRQLRSLNYDSLTRNEGLKLRTECMSLVLVNSPIL